MYYSSSVGYNVMVCIYGCIFEIDFLRLCRHFQPSFANHHSPILSMVTFPARIQTELLAFVRLAAHLASLSTEVQLQHAWMMEMETQKECGAMLLQFAAVSTPLVTHCLQYEPNFAFYCSFAMRLGFNAIFMKYSCFNSVFQKLCFCAQ